ncbi:hypothetical protein ACSLBF_20335 (plasmid) [Pseudoalteromonas sp. T1lg65]|uniref:hypothetical protein n=1 Tax=Pseudoalteromonas sp. T1lg65 TaxID=2077101 RepID=UPI003F79DE46
MRVFYTALISAFFLSFNSLSLEFKRDEQKPILVPTDYGRCTHLDGGGHLLSECLSAVESASEGKTYIYTGFHSGPLDDNSYPILATVTERRGCDGQDHCTFEPYIYTAGRFYIQFTVQVEDCPPDGHPTYTQKRGGETDDNPSRCIDPARDNCQEPSLDDRPSFSIGGGNRCFTNPDGSTCKYSSDNNDMMMVSPLYDGQEGTSCGDDGDGGDGLPTVPDPFIPPDLSDLPEAPSTAPSAEPLGQISDPSTSETELDGINQMNRNVTASTQNQVDFGRANVRALNNIYIESRHSNDLTRFFSSQLDVIGKNTQIMSEQANNAFRAASTNVEQTATVANNTRYIVNSTNAQTATLNSIRDTLNSINDKLAGDEPCEGEDCPDPEPDCEGFECAGVAQAGKQGGLNDLFTQDSIDEIRVQITDQIELNTAELDDIRTQLDTVFDVSPTISGSYEERTLDIYGESIDISVARFSNFYQMLAAPLMLIATMSALFILLRERHD